MALIFMFPGQNSRYPGMLRKFAALSRTAMELVERASDTLHRDFTTLDFSRNRDVQTGVFLASHLLLTEIGNAGVQAGWSLGLSLGEYNHLVHIGALSFEDALGLLAARGDAYDTSPLGAMASVAPISLEDLQAAIRGHDVTVALHNSPRQQVLSGARPGLDAALKILEDRFIQAVYIEQRLPMHSPLFDGVAERFRTALQSVVWHSPSKPYLPNVLGQFLWDPGPRDFVDLLARHTHSPVLWRESMELVASSVPDPVFVEVGPRAVLYNLMGRRWMDYPRFRTDTEENFQGGFEALIEEIKRFGQPDPAIAHPRGQAWPAVGTRPVHVSH